MQNYDFALSEVLWKGQTFQTLFFVFLFFWKDYFLKLKGIAHLKIYQNIYSFLLVFFFFYRLG